jgi:hypothetical protein
MGRQSGWITLHAGIACAADVILLPEIEFDLDRVCAVCETRSQASGQQKCTIIAVAEGARPIGHDQIVERVDSSSVRRIRRFTNAMLGTSRKSHWLSHSTRVAGLHFGLSFLRALYAMCMVIGVCVPSYPNKLPLASKSLIQPRESDLAGRTDTIGWHRKVALKYNRRQDEGGLKIRRLGARHSR